MTSIAGDSLRILIAGESWNTYAVHTKGASSYTTSSYSEGAEKLIEDLESSGHDVTFMPNHEAVEQFPFTAAELDDRFDVIILSDLPSDSLLLPHAVFIEGERRPNRMTAIGEWVSSGGALLMVGGYMSFGGFEGRARYGSTPLADVLPVRMLDTDDRVETPEGIVPLVASSHPVLKGIDGEWPYFLGYNRFTAKSGAETILTVGDDPMLVVGAHGTGRVGAFASDCSPHWGSPAFMTWPHYRRFWSQLVQWLADGDAVG